MGRERNLRGKGRMGEREEKGKGCIGSVGDEGGREGEWESHM